MDILKEKYTITELAEMLNITDHALRYYEKEFSLIIPRDSRGRRYYPAETANLFYQIRKMREEGLEIKAIRRILESEYSVEPPPPVAYKNGEESTALIAPSSQDLSSALHSFTLQLTDSLKAEIISSQNNIMRELQRSKLEIGACVENSSRKLESKLDKHFQEVDRYLTNWREKKRGGLLKNRLK